MSSQVAKRPQKPLFSSLLNHVQSGVSEHVERHSYWSKDSADPTVCKRRALGYNSTPGQGIRDMIQPEAGMNYFEGRIMGYCTVITHMK